MMINKLWDKQMKKSILLLIMGAFSVSAFADSKCAYELLGTDTRDYKNAQGEVVKQIIVPLSCTNFTIMLRNVTKMHKNTMGHNVVIAKEKDVKAIAIDGAIAGITKDYLKPGDTRVLAASKMVGGGEQTSVRFPVKKIKDGGYDFFCSFLGHERKMHGKLIVE